MRSGQQAKPTGNPAGMEIEHCLDYEPKPVHYPANARTLQAHQEVMKLW